MWPKCRCLQCTGDDEADLPCSGSLQASAAAVSSAVSTPLLEGCSASSIVGVRKPSWPGLRRWKGRRPAIRTSDLSRESMLAASGSFEPMQRPGQLIGIGRSANYPGSPRLAAACSSTASIEKQQEGVHLLQVISDQKLTESLPIYTRDVSVPNTQHYQASVDAGGHRSPAEEIDETSGGQAPKAQRPMIWNPFLGQSDGAGDALGS